MPQAEKYNLDFRPAYWWGPYDLETHYTSLIKGELRRAYAPSGLQVGMVDEEMLEPSLDSEMRSFLAGIHPWLMGGEYLPDFLPTEVEIARAVLKSVTMDVISIRARRTKNRILYRIVDEYPENPPYVLSQASSRRPLTLRQLITMIDKAGLQDARQMNYGMDEMAPDDYFDFVTLSSEFYPELARWYDEANEEWLNSQLERLAQMGEERTRKVDEFEADEALLARLNHVPPRIDEEASLAEKADPHIAGLLNSFGGRMDLVESVMKRHNFTLEEALQALIDFGA